MKAKKWACIATAAVMTASLAAIFAGCGEDKVTVTWYDGRTVIQTDKVESGSKITEWTPEKDGYEFKGWFAEASKTEKFDFSKPITADTDVYSSWLKVEYTADTNEYYLVGTGAGDMKASNWDQTTAKEGLTFVKDTSVTDKNVFNVTITLYAGDQFQICHGGAWDGQMGIGAVEGATKNENAAETDANYYEAKNADGDVVFCGSKGFGDDPVGWNAVLADGQDGRYKITLTTYPGQESNNVITWELVEKLEPMAETHKMYLVGTYNAEDASTWQDPATDKLYLDKLEDGTFRTFITVTEANYPTWDNEKKDSAFIKVKNEISGKDYGVDGGAENIPLTAGTWCITYNPEGDVVKFAKCEYYLVGTFLDGEAAVNFSVKDGVTPKLTTADDGATYTATLTATDVTGNSNYSWIADQNKPGVFAIKVVFGCELGIKDWYAQADGDNFYLAAGEHTVTFTVDGSTVTVD